MYTAGNIKTSGRENQPRKNNRKQDIASSRNNSKIAVAGTQQYQQIDNQISGKGNNNHLHEATNQSKPPSKAPENIAASVNGVSIREYLLLIGFKITKPAIYIYKSHTPNR